MKNSLEVSVAELNLSLNSILLHHSGVGVKVSARGEHEDVLARLVGALVVPVWHGIHKRTSIHTNIGLERFCSNVVPVGGLRPQLPCCPAMECDYELLRKHTTT